VLKRPRQVCAIAVAGARSAGIKGVMDLGEAIRLRPAALRAPLAELAGLPAEPAAGSAQTLPRVRHGIEFSARDDSNGELRVTGDDDAAVLMWAAAWLEEHRDWVVTGITFRYPAAPGDEGTTATVVFELASPGIDAAHQVGVGSVWLGQRARQAGAHLRAAIRSPGM
jgi:hypothetical protein